MIKIIIQGILVSLALSVDVFAVAIVEGLQIRSTHRTRKLLQMGSFFALTNVILLIGGYLLGAPMAAVFDRYDHWVALGLLLLVALHMLYEVVMGDRKRRKKDTNRAEQPEPRSEKAKMPAVKRIVMMALAVGIDAFAVGLSYSLSGAPIVIHSVIFFVTTLIICFIGGWLGGLVRPGFVKAAERARRKLYTYRMKGIYVSPQRYIPIVQNLYTYCEEPLRLCMVRKRLG